MRAELVVNPWLHFWAPHRLAWWIAVLNMLGSVAFMLAAVYTVFLPSSGEMQWAWAHRRSVPAKQ
jgi:hypothetical protein